MVGNEGLTSRPAISLKDEMFFGLIKDSFVLVKHGDRLGTSRQPCDNLNIGLWQAHYWALMGNGDSEVLKNGKQVAVYKAAPEPEIE